MRTTRVRAHHRGYVAVRSHDRSLNQREATEIQTLIFSQNWYSTPFAVKWAKEHGFKYGKVDVEKGTVRIRQKDPSEFKPKSFRTIEITNGVKAVIGHPKHPNRVGGGEGFYLVDRVTRTVRRTTEAAKDSPPRFVKVHASSPTAAVHQAIVAAPRNRNAARSRYPGLRNDFQDELQGRAKVAREHFEESLMQLGDLSHAEASRAFDTYKRLKILKFDPIQPRYTVKHGRFLDRDVIRRAAHEGG